MKIVEKIRIKAKDTMAASPVKIAILGDSVSHGCFETYLGGGGVYDHASVYHTRLKERIEAAFPNCPVAIINAAIGGTTAAKSVERVERDVISAQPDLAIVCFGLNDSGGDIGEYERSLAAIFEKLQAADIDVIFMTPNMMCTYKAHQIAGDAFLGGAADACSKRQNEGVMDAFMDCARAVCASHGVPVCDCYADWKRLYDLGADVTLMLANFVNHPSREMHRLFADRLFEMIFL